MSEYVQRYEKNAAGRDFVVGDIHGMFHLLQAGMDTIGFDPMRDRLFSVGDLVDRGPDSGLALNWIAQPWFHAVRGNHEDMAIRWPAGHMDARNYAANGGAWNIGSSPEVQLQVANTLGTLPIAIEVETDSGIVGIVHANCPFPTWREFVASLESPTISRSKRGQVVEAALWSRDRIQSKDCSGIPDVRAVIVGHTPLERPAALGNVYHVDTGVVFRGGNFMFVNLSTLELAAPTDKSGRQRCPVPMLCGVEFCHCPAQDLANATELLAEIPSLDGKTRPPAPTPAAVEANRMWQALKGQTDA